jgi:hypothetical protein
LAGCGEENFDQERERWRRERPDEYVIVVCETGLEVGCTLEAVSGATIVTHAFTLVESYGPDDWVLSEDYPRPGDPVEALFDRAEGASGDCDLDRVSFDDEFGYVEDYYLDCGEEGGGRRVTCFAPDTVDITKCDG